MKATLISVALIFFLLTIILITYMKQATRSNESTENYHPTLQFSSVLVGAL